MATTRFADHLLVGDHASRPAATDVPPGTLYSCTDHGIIYQSDMVVWSDYATISGVVGALAQMLMDSRAPVAHRHWANEANLPGLTAFVTALTGSVDLSALEMLIGSKAHASHRHIANEANLPGITALIAAAGGSAVDDANNILANQIFGA